MKRNKRRLSIPQHEFGFAPDTFTLIQETGQDGDRLARERAEADDARRAAESAQARLFTSKYHPRKILINSASGLAMSSAWKANPAKCCA
jgi:hypothetical protein